MKERIETIECGVDFSLWYERLVLFPTKYPPGIDPFGREAFYNLHSSPVGIREERIVTDTKIAVTNIIISEHQDLVRLNEWLYIPILPSESIKSINPDKGVDWDIDNSLNYGNINSQNKVSMRPTKNEEKGLTKLRLELKQACELQEVRLKARLRVWDDYVNACKDVNNVNAEICTLNKKIKEFKVVQEVKYYFDQVYMNQKGEICIIQLLPGKFGEYINIYNITTQTHTTSSSEYILGLDYISNITLKEVDTNNTYSPIKI